MTAKVLFLRGGGKDLCHCFPVIKHKDLEMTAVLCLVLVCPADPFSFSSFYIPKHTVMEGDELEVVPASPLTLRGRVSSLGCWCSALSIRTHKGVVMIHLHFINKTPRNSLEWACRCVVV